MKTYLLSENLYVYLLAEDVYDGEKIFLFFLKAGNTDFNSVIDLFSFNKEINDYGFYLIATKNELEDFLDTKLSYLLGRSVDFLFFNNFDRAVDIWEDMLKDDYRSKKKDTKLLIQKTANIRKNKNIIIRQIQGKRKSVKKVVMGK